MLTPALPLVEGLVAVCLWSTTPILVKMVLGELSPMQIAGIRYFGAALVMLPLVWRRSRERLRSLPREAWLRLILMGLINYSLANSLLFWGLRVLPATTSSFLLNATPIFTLVIGARWLGERPTRIQWLGVVATFAGAAVFFAGQVALQGWIWIAATLVGVLGISIFSILTREFARSGRLDTAGLTAVPMVFGGGLLLAIDPPPILADLRVWGVLAWLILFNSVAAHLLMIHAQKRLRAFESSLAINLMPMGTAVLSPLLLDEVVSARSWIGLLIALAGVVLVGLAGTSARQKLPALAGES